MTKVVDFPKHKIVREAPVNNEVVEAAKEKGLLNFSDSIVDDLLQGMIETLENYGVDVESKTFMKDFSLTADSLRASIYRQFGLDHNLHNFIDSNVKMMNRTTGELIIEDDDEEEELDA
jgi:hypothetical protein